MTTEALQVTDELVKRLDALGIPYFVVGSVASSSYGLARMTNDIDIVISLEESQIGPLVQSLSGDFYADADMMRDALGARSSFNVIHLSTMVKADFFLPEDMPFIQSEWARRRLRQIRVGAGGLPIYVASPEDMVLQKLSWYRMTGERSDRQWGDVQGILKVQADALDYDYMRRWAATMNIAGLLRKAFADAGIDVDEPGESPV